MALSSENSIPEADRKQILFYYFAFPHYRVSILQELHTILGKQAVFASGSQSRGGLKPLTQAQFPELKVFPSRRIGSLSWDKSVLQEAISKHHSVVVLGPATSSLTTWAILTTRRLFRRTTFLWGQCGKPDDRSVKRLLQEIMNRLASGLLVYGDYEVKGAQQWGTKSKKIHQVSNAVPLRPLSFTPKQLGQHVNRLVHNAAKHGALRLVYIGRINDEKNIEILLQAGELLKRKFTSFSICLIGDGPDIPRLRNQYPDIAYEFRGAIYDSKELEREMLSATFVVSPSTMGLLALDALSVGVPVLVPNHPRNGSETEALTRNINGFQFTHDDAQSLADQVEIALAELGTLDMDHYFLKRKEGLQAWSPAKVAENICATIMNYENVK